MTSGQRDVLQYAFIKIKRLYVENIGAGTAHAVSGVSSVAPAAAETGPGERHGPVTDSAGPETGGDTCHHVSSINSEVSGPQSGDL